MEYEEAEEAEEAEDETEEATSDVKHHNHRRDIYRTSIGKNLMLVCTLDIA